MTITIIVAAAENNAIGKNGQLLWHLPNDMKFFKNTTWAMPVIMGRKTFESLGKPLPGRTNIVISSQMDWQTDGVDVAHNLFEALEIARQMHTKEVFIIGGGQIYRESMVVANKIYLTRVHVNFDDADTFFDAINTNEWHIVHSQHFDADEKNKLPHTIETWERKD